VGTDPASGEGHQDFVAYQAHAVGVYDTGSDPGLDSVESDVQAQAQAQLLRLSFSGRFGMAVLGDSRPSLVP